MTEKYCESCGMPMKEPKDFGGENILNKYCKFCTDTEGNLKSYDEKLNDFKNMIMKMKRLDEQSALKMAKEQLKQFPAWK